MAWWFKPGTRVFIFAVLAVIVVGLLLGMMGIHLPYTAKYLTLLMMIAFYILVGFLRSLKS